MFKSLKVTVQYCYVKCLKVMAQYCYVKCLKVKKLRHNIVMSNV